MLTKENQSLLDTLLRIMPELRDNIGSSKVKTTNKAAKVLYNIWSNEASKVGDNKFRHTKSSLNTEIKMLESEGLVQASGSDLVITKKGGEVLKQMILGDDRSIFEDDGKPIEYLTAVANIKPSKRRKFGKTSSAFDIASKPRNWYETAIK